MRFRKLRIAWPAKRPFLRGAISIASMAVMCAACGAVITLEAVPLFLLAALVMLPATVLFLLVERYGGSKECLKHAIYFVYLGLWISFFTYFFLTDVEFPELSLFAMFLITVTAISGYAPLIGTWQFSLRTLIIATTLVAVMLWLAAFLGKLFHLVS